MAPGRQRVKKEKQAQAQGKGKGKGQGQEVAEEVAEEVAGEFEFTRFLFPSRPTSRPSSDPPTW
eukprot:756003-Hanusia_phi.AAC.1